ncbi:MAG TPA: phasin family protein [Geminicoccaceae bacterium]|nr:phasin family protein [Geminicoccaceae bacterium]
MPTRTRRPTGPFGAATRAARSGAELMRLATRTGEMMLAAGQTIDHRTGMLRDAWGDPVAMADPEFTLMASEKVDAFWRSHDAMGGKAAPAFQAWLTWLTAQARINMSAMTALSRCRSPQAAAAVQARYLQSSAVNAGKAAERLGRLGIAAAALGLTPVHEAATANAKRLLREK